MSAIAWILKAFGGTILEALLKAVTDAFKDWRAEMAQRDLGAAQQKQVDTEAAIKGKADANVIGLEPRDRAKTKGRLRDGTF